MRSALLRLFPLFAFITLVVLYLVVLAGSVVRATGSGMGCPDWPKCFGHLVPPTDSSQVQFHASTKYGEGVMIIYDKSLWSAKKEFTTGPAFDQNDWEKYETHNYAKFTVRQSWTEYLNRLLGATSAFCTMVLLIISLLNFRADKITPVLLVLGIGILAFVGWLGKLVVDQNLKPLTISMHMGSAMVMCAVIIYVYVRVRRNAGTLILQPVTSFTRGLTVAAILATLLQIGIGIMVRQQIDTINEAMQGTHRDTWIGQLDHFFTIHLVTAWLVVLTNAALFSFGRKTISGGTRWLLLATLLLPWVAYGAGVLMRRLGMPAALQPVHQLSATILFGVQMAILMRTSSKDSLLRG